MVIKNFISENHFNKLIKFKNNSMSFFHELVLCLSSTDTRFIRLLYNIINIIVGFNILHDSEKIGKLFKLITSEQNNIFFGGIGFILFISGIFSTYTTTKSIYNKLTMVIDGIVPTAMWGLVSWYVWVYTTRSFDVFNPLSLLFIIPLALYIRYPSCHRK